MTKKLVPFAVVPGVLLAVALAACAPQSPPPTLPAVTPAPTTAAAPALSPAPGIAKPKPATPAATPVPRTVKPKPATPAKAAWEEKWDRALAEAKKEGEVVVYSNWGPQVRDALKPFAEKYGIKLEYVAAGRGAETVAKVTSEMAAGIHTVDLIGSGSTTLVFQAKPAGILAPLEPLMLLPEVVDPSKWRGKELPFLEKDKVTLGMSFRITNNVVVNTEVIKPGEITSVKDLLKPKYKGMVSINDPSVGGSGNGALASLGFFEWKSQDEALKFLKDMMANGSPVVRDNRLQVEWLAQKKYPIAFGAHADSLATFLRAGAKLMAVVTKEGAPASPGSGAVAVARQQANPAATVVFLNWLLSREGQIAFVKGTGSPVTRIDVSLEGIEPIFIPPPEQKVYPQTEEYIAAQGTLTRAVKPIVEGAK